MLYFSLLLNLLLLFSVLVICHVTDAQQCTTGVELSVDGQILNTSTTLYRPISSNFTVRCRRCRRGRGPPWRDPSNDEISTSCDPNVPTTTVCTTNPTDSTAATDLMFSSLTRSLEGKYQCTRNPDNGGVITIKVFEITAHPQDRLVPVGSSVSLTCTSSVSSDVTFSWTRDGNSVTRQLSTSAGTSTLTINNVRRRNGGVYVCTVKAGSSSLTSNAATVTVYGPPVITAHPTGGDIRMGRSITLMCRASGLGTLVYSWERRSSGSSWTTVSNDNTTSYTTNSNMAVGQYMYRCIVSNEAGPVMSNSATVNVYGPPTIITHPTSQLTTVSMSVTLNCEATGRGSITYQWQNRNINGGQWRDINNNRRLVVSDLQESQQYRCVVSNEAGRTPSNVASVTVLKITTHPQDRLVPVGSSVSLTCTSSVSSDVTFSWTHNGRDVTGQSTTIGETSILTITSVRSSDDGSYVCTVRSGSLSVISDTATLTTYEITTHPSSTTVIALQDVTLTCSSSVDDVTYSWHRDGGSVPPRSRTGGRNSNSLTIRRVTPRDEGMYYCMAGKEGIGVESDRAVLRVDDLLSVNASLNVLSGNDSKTAQLTASAGGINKENFIYHWRAQNKNNLPNKVSGVNRTLLTIPDFDKSDEGQYYCIVTNEWGRNMTSNSVTLTVEDQLQPDGTSSNDSGGSGGGGGSLAVVIIGVLVALMIIVIIIIILILLLVYYKKRYRSKPKSQNMKSTTDGIPMSGKKSEIKRGAVHVQPSRDQLEETPIRDASFSICIESDQMNTSVGQPTTLFIEIPDLPKPEITWLKDGRPVNHPVLLDGSLFIIKTDISDQGKYTVTVNSDGNIASESIQLTVHNPQLPVDNSELSTIQAEDFAEHVVLMKDEGNAIITEEFESISVDAPFTHHAGKIVCNKAKNRYKNILPYDHSRVVLSQQEQLSGSDYINASFVNGHGKSRVYIAAQGPLKNSADDFWRMIWEQNVTTIVMVTRLVEDAKIKCQQYWPNDGSTVFGTVKVTLQKEEQLTSYCVRQLSVTNVSSLKKETRVVHQFHFTAWPDHGVPKYATGLLQFQKRVDKHYTRKGSKPMLVHCSAGVGRTGTFIAIDNEIQRIKQEGATDIHSFVCQMRFCRNFMVQTLPQYMFIHTALLEYINCGDTSIAAPINNVQNKIDELSATNHKKGKTGFQLQFEKLVRNSPKESDFTYVAAVSSKNKSKNRSKQLLPPESARVIVPQYDGGSDYINFCFVDGYNKTKAFLAGPGPMQSTATDFWTMLWEKKSYTIIMLGQLKENETEASFKYWPIENKGAEFGRFLIETVSEDVRDKGIVKRTFKVTNGHQDASRTITQLQYVEWSQDSCPKSCASIIDLIKVLEYVQHENGNGPITVHCSNGVGRSGTFCALLNCINRFRQEQVIDVFQVVQMMRSQRPGLVENTEQYQFIHKALVAAIQKNS